MDNQIAMQSSEPIIELAASFRGNNVYVGIATAFWKCTPS